MDFESLGFTQEELQERVISTICDRLLTQKGWDDEDREHFYSSQLEKRVTKALKTEIDQKVSALFEEHITPNVETIIQNTVMQKTNEWGEAKGAPITLTEYLTERAENYLLEKVDSDGNTRGDRSGYSLKEAQTRITFLVNKKLNWVIEDGMKEAAKSVYSVLSDALTETAKIKLSEVAQSLKFSVKGI